MSAATGARSGAGELLADRAYVELRDQIVSLAIAPGGIASVTIWSRNST